MIKHLNTHSQVNLVVMNPSKNFWENKNVFITGITGFVGSWLAEILSNEFDANIFGLIRRQANPGTENIAHLIKEDKIKLIRGDIHDTGSLVGALKESDAQIVFHLAAQSFVPHSFNSPFDTYQTNVLGTTNVLDAIKIVDKNIKIHFAGSSEEYGLIIIDNNHYKKMLERYKIIFPPPKFDDKGHVISEVPIKETNPLRTVGTSPYGSSKRMCEDVCRTYMSCYNMNVFITRSFNHTGPRRGEEFVTTQITKQIAEGIKYGKKEIVLGNLDAIRDFTNVKDIVKGYMLTIERGEPGNVYNLCSGKGVTIKELKDIAIDIAKKKFNLKHEMEYVLDKNRLRQTELPILIGDNSKAKELLGWEPTIPLEKTLEDMIVWQLSKI